MYMIKKLFGNLVKLLALALCVSDAVAGDLSCTYTVLSNWGSGSQVTFKITNNTNQDISDWKMQVSYPLSYQLSNSWQVKSEGKNPIVFSSSNGGALKPGEWNSYHFGYQMAHNGAAFVVPTIDYCGKPAQSVNQVKKTISTSGGLIEMASVGSVWFQDGSLPASTEVTLSTTSDTAVATLFEETAGIFRTINRSGYEIRVGTGNVRPQSNEIMAEIIVPSELADTIAAGEGIEVLAGIEQGGSDEVAYTSFDILQSEYDPATNKLTFELPAAAFANTALTGGQYQAILVIATTPGAKTSSPVSTLSFTPQASNSILLRATAAASGASGGACQAATIACPVAGGCIVNSPFVPNRINPVNGVSRPHSGVDYKAIQSTGILAAANGVVEKSQFHSGGHGEVVIIRHTDGSATLYAHLSARDVAVGQAVSKGQQIGYAGKTGLASGVHLHFEYVPNGEIYGSKNKIDPDACIDALASGSITIFDSGALADDAFRVELGGYILGETTIGGTNTLAVNNLRPGLKPLRLVVTIAPDNVGTYTIVLNDGLTFLDGTTSATGSAPQGYSSYWDVIIP